MLRAEVGDLALEVVFGAGVILLGLFRVLLGGGDDFGHGRTRLVHLALDALELGLGVCGAFFVLVGTILKDLHVFAKGHHFSRHFGLNVGGLCDGLGQFHLHGFELAVELLVFD